MSIWKSAKGTLTCDTYNENCQCKPSAPWPTLTDVNVHQISDFTLKGVSVNHFAEMHTEACQRKNRFRNSTLRAFSAEEISDIFIDGFQCTPNFR